MLERAALNPWENTAVQDLAHFLDLSLGGCAPLRIIEIFTDKDDASTRSAQSLVGGRCNYMRVFYRIFKQTGSDKPGSMSHIDPEDGSHLVCNRAHTGVVPLAGICRGSAYDETRLAFEGFAFHLVVIHHARFGIQPVGNCIVENSGSIYGRAVGEVSSLAEVQAHKSIARLQHSHDYGHIGLGTGVGLHICPAGSVDLLESVDGQLFDLVHYAASSIVTLSGITFSIFVCAYGSHRLHDLVGHIVLRCNKFESALLARTFLADQVENL